MKEIRHQYDFVVVGGGLAGFTAAITAARNGIKTALINDRPVLDGNASKEIQVPPVGAHYADHNYAYFREIGFIEELLLENLKRNTNGNPEIWDLVLMDYVKQHANLEVFLNTAVNNVTLSSDGKFIFAVKGYTSDSEIWHTYIAPYFADCTGDGTIGALAGAPFRRGCEARAEFGESMASEEMQQREMGCSIRFRAKDTGRPVPFVLRGWMKYHFDKEDFGPCRPIESEFKRNNYSGFWWIEWGGFLDSIHDINQIHDELLQIVYGLWDYLKNRSSLRDELISFDLDWVGSIPGKRENRRFEGEYILTQNDIEKQKYFEDAVAYGGWGFDDHPPAGIFDKEHGNYHTFHAGPYNVPLHCLYSKKIANLFFAGRNISVSHVALSSTRVMMTCAQFGEAVGMAATVCHKLQRNPSELYNGGQVFQIQKLLQRVDHTIMGLPFLEEENLAHKAQISASSQLNTPSLENSIGVMDMDYDYMWMFPVSTNHLREFDILVDVEKDTKISYGLYAGPKNHSTYPEKQLIIGTTGVRAGKNQWIALPLECNIEQKGWHFIEVCKNPDLKIHYGKFAPVGLKAMHKRVVEDPIRPNPYSKWIFRRDLEKLTAYCCRIRPTQPIYEVNNIINPWNRPTELPNLWISAASDFREPEWFPYSNFSVKSKYFSIDIIKQI